MEASDELTGRVLADIERSEKDILATYRGPVQTPGPVGYQHLYLFGIARRALAQSLASAVICVVSGTDVALLSEVLRVLNP